MRKKCGDPNCWCANVPTRCEDRDCWCWNLLDGMKK